MKIKKTLSIILMLCMILGNHPIAVFAEEKVDAQIYSKSGLTSDEQETIDIPVYLQKNPGLMGYALVITYDTQMLQVLSVERAATPEGGNFNDDIGGTKEEPGKLRVMWNAAEEYTEDGLLFTIHMQAKKAGKTKLKLEADENETYDGDFKELSLTCADIELVLTHTHDYADWVILSEATCLEEGLMTRVCTICGEEETQTIPVDPEAHLPGDTIIENEIVPTVETEGSYDEVVYCQRCGQELSRKTIAVPRLADRTALYDTITQTIQNIANTRISSDGKDVDLLDQWVDQQTADDLLDAITAAMSVYTAAEATQDEVDAARKELETAADSFNKAKQYGKKTSTSENRQTDALLEEISAAVAAMADTNVSADGTDVDQGDFWVTQAELDQLMDAIHAATALLADQDAGQSDINNAVSVLKAAKEAFIAEKKPGTREPFHDYELTSWFWAENYSLAEATFTCKNADAHVKKVVDSHPKCKTVLEETCGNDRVVSYTATVVLNKKTYTTTTEEVVLHGTALPHTWSEPTYTWSADNLKVTAEVKCQNDASHRITETADTTYEVIQEPTVDKEGTGRFTAAFDNELFETQTKEVRIPKQQAKPVEQVQLDATELELKVDDNYQLTASISPEDASNKKVTWSSADTKIASVDAEGKITANHTGTTVITVTTEDGGHTASCKVTVIFKDVPSKGKYFSTPVYWAVERGITNGYQSASDRGSAKYGTFGPEENCTREQMITFLWRQAGKPDPKSSTVNVFKDVKKGTYYYKAVLWAYENNITKGYSTGAKAGTFGVGENVTREDTVTFIYRMAGKPGVSKADQSKYTFSDVKSGKYYANPIVWAAKNGITKGYSSGEHKGKFGVGFNVLRKDIVTFLYRYDSL